MTLEELKKDVRRLCRRASRPKRKYKMKEIKQRIEYVHAVLAEIFGE